MGTFGQGNADKEKVLRERMAKKRVKEQASSRQFEKNMENEEFRLQHRIDDLNRYIFGIEYDIKYGHYDNELKKKKLEQYKEEIADLQRKLTSVKDCK